MDGNYDQVNRLCAEIAELHPWSFVNVHLRPYYTEGSKTVGFQIAEQVGCRPPDNIVVPMAGAAQITKAFSELIATGLVEAKLGKVFGAQARSCSPISTEVPSGATEITPQVPNTSCKSLAIGNPADGCHAIKAIRSGGGWPESATDPEIVAGMRLLAEMEGVVEETAGGVTVAATEKLIRDARIRPGESTVLCITRNGLKTTDALVGAIPATPALAPELAAFENQLGSVGVER